MDKEYIKNEMAILERHLDGLEFEFENDNISKVEFKTRTSKTLKQIVELEKMIE